MYWRFRHSIPLFLALLLISACERDNLEPQPRSNPCQDPSSIEDLRACLSDTYWRLESVQSDIPRDGQGFVSTNWLDYQDPCYADVEMHIVSYVQDPNDSRKVNMLCSFSGIQDGCSKTFSFDLSTTDFLKSATVSYGEAFSPWMFGISKINYSVTNEKWRDIKLEENSIRIKLEQKVESFSYNAIIELRHEN